MALLFFFFGQIYNVAFFLAQSCDRPRCAAVTCGRTRYSTIFRAKKLSGERNHDAKTQTYWARGEQKCTERPNTQLCYAGKDAFWAPTDLLASFGPVSRDITGPEDKVCLLHAQNSA